MHNIQPGYTGIQYKNTIFSWKYKQPLQKHYILYRWMRVSWMVRFFFFKLVLSIYQDQISIQHKTEGEGKGGHLSCMMCFTQAQKHKPTVYLTHTHTHTMSQSSFGPSAGSSVRVTAIYSVPSISTDCAWSLPTHHPHKYSSLPQIDSNTNIHIHS